MGWKQLVSAWSLWTCICIQPQQSQCCSSLSCRLSTAQDQSIYSNPVNCCCMICPLPLNSSAPSLLCCPLMWHLEEHCVALAKLEWVLQCQQVGALAVICRGMGRHWSSRDPSLTEECKRHHSFKEKRTEISESPWFAVSPVREGSGKRRLQKECSFPHHQNKCKLLERHNW